MSSSRIGSDKPGPASEAAPRNAPEADAVPAPTKASELFGAARMDPVRRERAAAGSQIQHRMKVWRSPSGHAPQGQANAQSAPPAHGAGQPDAQAAAASGAPASGGGASGAAECAGGRILINTVIDPNPAPNTSQDQATLQTQGGGEGLTEQHLVGFTREFPDWHAASQGGHIHITLRLHLPAMFVASQLTQYPGAVDAVVRHESGHRRLWEQALRASVDFLRTDFNSQVTGAPTGAQVSSIMNAQLTQLRLTLRQAGDEWDREDYPRLHSELRALGVPANLPQASPAPAAAGAPRRRGH